MVRYSGDKPKSIAINEMRMKLLGDSRWVGAWHKNNQWWLWVEDLPLYFNLTALLNFLYFLTTNEVC
jgi:hypothetical protein